MTTDGFVSFEDYVAANPLENFSSRVSGDSVYDAYKAYVDEHTVRTDNPHAVTAAQVGAYTVEQVEAALLTKADKFSIGDAAALDVGTGPGTVAAGDDSRFASLATHLARTDNPHGVTAAQITYASPGSGAVAQSLYNLLRDIPVKPEQFGAVGDGVADDAAAIQACINYAASVGTSVEFPRPAYRLGAQITVPDGVGALRGRGIQRTWIFGTQTQNYFLFTGENGIEIEGFFFDCADVMTPRTGGTALKFDTGNTTVNYRTRISNCTFARQYYALDFERAAEWAVIGCSFNETVNTGITVRNLANEDAGDSLVMGCTFHNAGVTTGTFIQQESSGGLRIIGNKFNGGAYGYVLSLMLATAPATSVLLIQGNSFENQSTQAITLQRGGGSGLFEYVLIQGNEIAYCPLGIILVTGSFLSSVQITGNTIALPNTGGTCIAVDGGDAVLIGPNLYVGHGGTSYGVQTASAATNVYIRRGVFKNLSTGMSVGTGTEVEPTTLSGTVNITCNTAYGPLWKGTATISFPTGLFSVVPNVRLTIIGTGGNSVGCALSGGVTQSGVLAEAYAVASGASVVLRWEATGF